MTQSPELEEIHRLIAAEAPDAGDALVAFLDQPEDAERFAGIPDAMRLDQLRRALLQGRSQRSKQRRIEKAREVWSRYLAQDVKAPQMALAEVITGLYQQRTGPARELLRTLIAQAPLRFGMWGGLKRVYKQVERDLDAELFGAFAARFDLELTRGTHGRDVSVGTLRYLSRRTWRFLRQLGKANAELYPVFSVEVLRSYPQNTRLWAMGCGRHIRNHFAVKWGFEPETKGKPFQVPYRSTWARSPDPLMLLLETGQCDDVAALAIEGLRELFPDALRQVTPEWLARLCARPVGRAHELVIDTLEGNPDYHTARLQQLGMHDAVFALLRSPSVRARTYAIAYARGHVSGLSTEHLVDLLDDDVYERDVIVFAAEVLAGRPPREVGLPMVVRLLRYEGSRAWAQEALRKDFEPTEIPTELLTEMLQIDDNRVGRFARAFLTESVPTVNTSPPFWITLLEHPRTADGLWDLEDYALERLGELPLSTFPADWVLRALGHETWGDAVWDWLAQADALPIGLDAERIKGLVFDPSTRELAFTLLDNPKLVKPGDVGVDWLLALARRADPTLHVWAHRYVLQHVSALELGDGSADAGVARMFSMAVGKKESETARRLAQTWLLCHHPTLGPQQLQTRELSIQSSVAREAFTADRVWPTLWDDRADVRRFGVAIARAELARWADPARVYELADSFHREVRAIAYDALSQAGKQNADPALAMSLDDLDPAMVFSMTESTVRSTRDVAMALIREHYRRLGGAERLGWLMQSADREVRMFAVRLLWERHRPTSIPTGWAPQGGASRAAATPFEDAEALRNLLRRLLFAVPPGRGGEKGDRRGGRRLPASAAKRRIVEVVRDFGLRDRSFAELVAPVLAEFTGSVAKGEWQACLSALMTLRAAHDLPAQEMI